MRTETLAHHDPTEHEPHPPGEWSLQKSLEFVKFRRPEMNPSPFYMKQLKRVAQIGDGIACCIPAEFPWPILKLPWWCLVKSIVSRKNIRFEYRNL